MTITYQQKLGQAGEQAVIDWLLAHDFSIRTQNFRTCRGEVDIIAQRHDVIAFIEVKTRLSRSSFPLSTIITTSKQRKIARAALEYIAQHNLSHTHTLRFDVAIVTPISHRLHFEVDYIENAFTSPL